MKYRSQFPSHSASMVKNINNFTAKRTLHLRVRFFFVIVVRSFSPYTRVRFYFIWVGGLFLQFNNITEQNEKCHMNWQHQHTNNHTQFNIQILWRRCGEAKIKVFLIVACINLILCFSSLLCACERTLMQKRVRYERNNSSV